MSNLSPRPFGDARTVIEDYLEQPKQRKLAAAYRRDQRRLLLQLAERVSPRRLTEATTDDVVSWLAGHDVEPKTRAVWVGIALRFFDYVVASGHGSSNPVAPLRVDARPKPHGRKRLPVDAELNALISDYFSTRSLAPLTRRSQEDTLRIALPAFGKPVVEVTRLDMQRMVASWAIAPSTARTRLSVLRGFFEYLVLAGKAERAATLGVRPPREPRRLPRALPAVDVATVLAHCGTIREQLIILLGVQEGLRRKEIAGLELGDIDFAQRTARVVGKGDHERLVPLSDETLGLIRRYILEEAIRSGPLLRSRYDRTRGLSPVTVGRLVTDIMWSADVKGAAYDGKSTHALRHTAATDMIRGGAHLRDLQGVLGHLHLATTERYLPMEVRGKRDALGHRQYLPGPRPFASQEPTPIGDAGGNA